MDIMIIIGWGIVGIGCIVCMIFKDFVYVLGVCICVIVLRLVVCVDVFVDLVIQNLSCFCLDIYDFYVDMIINFIVDVVYVVILYFQY